MAPLTASTAGWLQRLGLGSPRPATALLAASPAMLLAENEAKRGPCLPLAGTMLPRCPRYPRAGSVSAEVLTCSGIGSAAADVRQGFKGRIVFFQAQRPEACAQQGTAEGMFQRLCLQGIAWHGTSWTLSCGTCTTYACNQSYHRLEGDG